MNPAGSCRAAVEEMRLTVGRSSAQPVPALGEQRLVGGRAAAARCGQKSGELTSFQTTTSRIFGIRFKRVLEEAAVVPTLDIVERGLVWLSVHGQDDALPTGDHRRGAMEVDAGFHGRPVLALPPRDRQPNGVDSQVAVRREQAVGPRPPLGRVVVETDQQLPREGRTAGRKHAQRVRTRTPTTPPLTTAALPKDAGLSHLAPAARQAGTVQLSRRTSSAASGRRNGVAT